MNPTTQEALHSCTRAVVKLSRKLTAACETLWSRLYDRAAEQEECFLGREFVALALVAVC